MDIRSRAPLNLTDISTRITQNTQNTTDTTDLNSAPGESCGCCAPTQTTPTRPATADAVSAEYLVDGLTCGSCAGRVSVALTALSGVEDVQISLVPGGTSTVSVTSSRLLPQASVRDAVENAGYQITTV